VERKFYFNTQKAWCAEGMAPALFLLSLILFPQRKKETTLI